MEERLLELGLQVIPDASGTQAILSLEHHPILNPLTRHSLTQVVFAVTGDRLAVAQPPDLVGIAPIGFRRLSGPRELEELVHAAFSDILMQLQRRSNQLQAMGIQPRVDPGTLQLTAELKGAEHDFLIGQDRRGACRILKARRLGVDLDVPAGHTFEISEFRERSALLGYLVAFVGGDPHSDPALLPGDPGDSEPPLRYEELLKSLGPGALIPPHSPVDVLMLLKAGRGVYRFAAARVVGRTFRGLLAGASGKLWAERFELDGFIGPRALLAELLGIQEYEVEVLSGDKA